MSPPGTYLVPSLTATQVSVRDCFGLCFYVILYLRTTCFGSESSQHCCPCTQSETQPAAIVLDFMLHVTRAIALRYTLALPFELMAKIWPDYPGVTRPVKQWDQEFRRGLARRIAQKVGWT